MIQAYEIQTYQGGVWQVDSVFDDEELAVFEARGLYERGRYVGVRVVLETYDQETDNVTVRTVLKLSKTDAENAVAHKRQAETDQEIRQNKKRSSKVVEGKKKVIKKKRLKRKARKAWIGVGAQLAIVVVLGLALLIGMRVVFQFL